MGHKLLKTVQTITTFRNPLADPIGTCRGPPLVRGPQFENRCSSEPNILQQESCTLVIAPCWHRNHTAVCNINKNVKFNKPTEQMVVH